MDEFLTKIWQDEPVRWRVFFVLLNAFFSVLCGLITQDVILMVIYVMGTAFIDILVEIYNYIDVEKVVSRIFAIKKYKRYLCFLLLAALPAVCGIAAGEAGVSESLWAMLFAKLIPNMLGALTVCSIMDHISKFDYHQIVRSLVTSKRDLLNVFMRTAFFGCYLNAVNYRMKDGWNWINIVDGMYLFVIVYCGAIALASFVLRIIDRRYFCCTAREIYPAKTLYAGGLFLISCGVGPLFCGIERHEPVLLMMNSVTACVIAIFVAVFVARRTENRLNTYPFSRMFLFIVVMGLNCWYNYDRWDRTGNIQEQLISGSVIFIFVLSLLLWTNKMQQIRTRQDL